MRDYVFLYINGEPHKIRGSKAFLNLSDYLRYEKGLTGTKVVCAEGDCAACTVFRGFPHPNGFQFEAINSCIAPVALLDSSHIITIEGLQNDGCLSVIQESMVKHGGSQCGFCTPGFVMAITNLYENKAKKTSEAHHQKRVQNYLTGNLCRCTGYQPIIKAALDVDPKKIIRLQERYYSDVMFENLKKHYQQSVHIHDEKQDQSLYLPSTLPEALQLKNKHPGLKLISAATDLGVQRNKGRLKLRSLMSLHLIDELYQLNNDKGRIHVGAKTSLTSLQNFLENEVPSFEQFLNIFASLQIKNVATLIGNIANGSPIADTLPFLFITNAMLTLRAETTTREISIRDFYQGYKKFDLKENEIITMVSFESPNPTETLRLYKTSQRRDLDISCVNAGFRYSIKNNTIASFHIAYGGVGPTTLRLVKTESFLKGKPFTSDTVKNAIQILKKEIAPISDVRGSRAFRMKLSENIFYKLYFEYQHAQK